MTLPKPARDYADKFKGSNGVVDFYKFLGIPAAATEAEITHAMMTKASVVEGNVSENFLKMTMLDVAQKHLSTQEARAAYDHKLAAGVGGPSARKHIIVDFILFFALPAVGYALAEHLQIVDSDIYRGLMIALASTGVAYLAAFGLTGGYTAVGLRQRFGVIAPAFLFTSVYWCVLVISRIADGYGEGNVLALLFGLVVAGAIARQRITSIPRR